jgi:hypothetical protein
MSEELERRISHLEKLLDAADKRDTEQQKNELQDLSKLDTLESILEQIALRLGASQSEYSSHYVAQYNRHLGKYLDLASRISEHLAAPLDDRELDQIDVGDVIPPLFPDQ